MVLVFVVLVFNFTVYWGTYDTKQGKQWLTVWLY